MKKIFIVVTAFFLTLTVFAQPQKVVADKIIGIVGDKIILRSDVYNEIQDKQRRNEVVPENAPCVILDQVLIIKALTLQAEKDSIIVTDEEIEAELENRIRYYVQNYGSKEALEEIAGKTVYQIKEDFRQSIKEMKLAKRMQEKVVDNVKITRQEAKIYWG